MLTVAATLSELLAERARKHPDKIGFRFLTDAESCAETLTYAQLDMQARGVAAQLERYAQPGDRALLLHAPGLDYITALFGCSYAGVVAVPAMAPSSSRPVTSLLNLLADTGAKLVLAGDASANRLQRRLASSDVGDLRWLTPPGQSETAAARSSRALPEPGQLAVLQYTSGSTTAPKGVMLSHGALMSNVRMLVEHLHITPSDSLVGWLPPYHDMGLIGAILTPLYAAVEATLFAPAAFLQRPLRWLEAIARYGATLSGGPNFAYELCIRRSLPAEREKLDLSRWRVAFSGAERVRAQTLERFVEAFAPSGFRRSAFCPCYGLAEATLGVSFSGVGAGPSVSEVADGEQGPGGKEPETRSLVSNGPPLPGLEVLIVDAESRCTLPAGAKGEIWVRGPSVALGYWNKPALTASVFRAQLASDGAAGPGYLRTADLGFFKEGELYVTGRLKDLIILFGVNHHPEDIEAALEDCHPSVRAAGSVAFAIEGEEGDELAVVVEVDSRRDVPVDEIQRAVRGALASEQELRADRVLIVGPGGIPRTSSGKLRRSECRRLFLDGKLPVLAESIQSKDTPPVAADPQLTELVCGLMAELLSVERVDPDADFFALGGHSLLATQLVARVREVLEIELPLSVLFESPTARGIGSKLRSLPSELLPAVSRRGGDQPKLLSFSQERMWFLQQVDPEGTAYNVAGGVLLEGQLDIEALDMSLRSLLERHEILRTNYVSQGGRPEIVVASSRPFSVVRRDLSGLPEPEREAERLASALASRPFDLARDLLIRAELYQLGPQRHALAACLHHVVGDGWSMGILLAELLGSYAAARAPAGAGPQADQSAWPGYLDYAAWQRRELVPRRFSDELRYWRKQLAGAPLLELPTDRPRKTRRASAGALHTLELPDELMERLSALGRAQGATLFMVMLAAFETLLHRWTGSADIVVGTPVANRTHLAAEKLVGTLVNTIALRVRFDPDEPFTSLLRATRASALDAWAHQELPFERLVSELGVPRIPGRSPLFEVMFDFQNSPMPVDAASDLRLRPLKLARGAAQFELSLLVLDTELGRLAGIEYSTALFDAETIQRFGAHYLQILGSIASDAGQPVSCIPLHTPAQEEALVALATRASGSPFAHPVQAFATWVQRAPDRIAVGDGTTSWTYAELSRRVDELAARLRAAGARPGERIAIFLGRSSHVPLALLAVLKTGAAYLPVDPGHPDARIGHVLSDAQPLAVLTETALRQRAAGLNAGPCLLVDAAIDAAVEAPCEPPADESLAAYILYTSGSTGRPKGVEVSVGSLSNFFASMAREPGMNASDRLLSVTTIAFDIASLELLLPLTVGAEIYVASAAMVADGQALRALLEREPFTVLQATPSAYRLLLAAGFEGAKQLTALVGGEPLDRQLAEQLLARVARLWNMYGPTETTVWSTLRRVQADDDPVPIGVPIDRTSVYVLDQRLALAPLGVPGEICIGGAGVARGYWRQPMLSAEKFLPDPFAGGRFGKNPRLYRTGDRGRLRADGLLECLGRVDQQVKIRGHRVELGEVEAVLRQAPGVRDCVASCRELGPGDVRLAAYYTTDAPGSLDAGQLRKLMRQALPDYMVPTELVHLDAIPLTPNGKVNRAALPQPSLGAGVSAREHVSPRSPSEELLAELWGEALGIERPSVVDDFFALGGHSLLAVRLLASVERRTGISLPLAALLEQPTIEQLARRLVDAAQLASKKVASAVEAVGRAREFSFMVPIQAHGNKPPLFCVHGAGGNVLNLHALAQKLGQSRPFFAIQAAGVDGVATPLSRIEEMADAYLAELVKVQPHGPYFLSGYCGGGIVAYEMAQRLLAAGQEIALLALMDVFRPDLPVFVTPISARIRAVREQGPAYLWQGGKRLFFRNWRNFWTAVRIRYHLWVHGAVPHALREFWLMSCFLRGARHYAAQPYPRKLTVLRAKDSAFPEDIVGRDLGWGAVSAGGLELYEVPGDHDTLAHEPHVSTLAETLSHCVAQAEAAAKEP